MDEFMEIFILCYSCLLCQIVPLSHKKTLYVKEKKHSILLYVLQMNMNGNDHLPSNFNAVQKWPGKIHEPLDQGNCNASWAFSTAGESEKTWQTTAEENCRVVLCVCYIIPLMQFICPVAHMWFTPSCCIRPDLDSVNGSHDPSALTSESDLLWQASSGRVRGGAYRRGLVVPEEKRVIHCMFY